jgi:hypothetical protein
MSPLAEATSHRSERSFAMSRRSPHRRRLARVGGALAVLAVLAGTPFVLSGSAQAAGTFEGTAAAYGVDYLMQNVSIPGGFSPQFSGPVAQASLTSLPSGSSFASFPYPGEAAAGVPGLIPALVTGLPQTPAYPFLITAGLGEGKKEINQPGIGMRAQTEDSDATAHAVLGTEGSGAVSDASVRVSGDIVSAQSIARQGALTIGEQGEIGNVIAKASAVRGYDGKLEKTSSLAISGIRFPGLQFTMPPTTPAPAPVPNAPSFPQAPAPFAGMTFLAPTFGFYDGQFTVQLPGVGPQQYAVDGDAVFAAFKSAGVEMTYSKPVETANGITGATVTFHWLAPAPPDNPLYSGTTDVSFVLGRASATIGGDSSTGFGTSGAGVDTAGDGIGSAVPGAGVDGAGLPGVDAAGLGTAGALPGTDSPSGVGSNGVLTANLDPAGDRVQATTTNLDIDALSNLYWVLVAAGVIAIFSAPTLRLLGARSS